MKYCENCKVRVRGSHETCPLCGMNLIKIRGANETEIEDKDVFPYLPTIFQMNEIVFRILIFISITVAVIAVAIDLMMKGVHWSIFVIAGLGCFWVSFYTAYSKRKNIPKNLLYQVVIISIIVILWDTMTGWKGWSIDYVIPFVCLSDLLVLLLLNRILHSDVEDYMIYTLIGGIFGIVPILFYVTGCLHVIYPSILCTAASIIFLAAVFMFQGTKIFEELGRRLHY